MSKAKSTPFIDPFTEIDQATRDKMAQARGDSDKAAGGIAISPIYQYVHPDNEQTVELLTKLSIAIDEIDQLKSRLQTATAQIAVLKSQSNGNGIGSHLNPDGSLSLQVLIDADTVLGVSPWQEHWGTNIEETARRCILEALPGYINSGG